MWSELAGIIINDDDVNGGATVSPARSRRHGGLTVRHDIMMSTTADARRYADGNTTLPLYPLEPKGGNNKKSTMPSRFDFGNTSSKETNDENTVKFFTPPLLTATELTLN